MRSLGLLLALCAVALTSWVWLGGRDHSTPLQTRTTEAPPQMILTGVHQLTTDASGVWLGTLQATRVLHFEAANRVQLEDPDWLSQHGAGTRQMTAQTATLIDEHFWTLEHQVRIQEQSPGNPPMRIKTEYLEYDTLLQQATTPAAVALDQAGRMTTEAIGMDIDFNAEEFFLHEQVRTRYWP